MTTNNKNDNNQGNGELYESRIYTFGRVRSHTFMNDKSLMSEELEEQRNRGARRYLSMEESWLRKSHSNNDVIQLSLISDDPYEVLNFDPHGNSTSYYGARLDKQLPCQLQKSTEAGGTCQACQNGSTHFKRGGCVSVTSNLSTAGDLRYSRSSLSSIPSHYVNKIFSITCIIVMISCFAVLVSFAVFAGFQDVKSIQVQKHQPEVLDKSTGNHLSGYNNGQKGRTKESDDDNCSIQIVETIPEILKYSAGSVKFNSTYHAWDEILASAVSSNTSSDIRIASAYWTLLSKDVSPEDLFNPRSIKGEDIFRQLNIIAKKTEGPGLSIVNNYPGSIEQGNDTDILQASGAEVRLLNMPPLVGAGILHTKLIINPPNGSLYVGSANMDWRSLSLVKEMGLHFSSCPTLTEDILKIFTSYYLVAKPDAQIPQPWPESLNTHYNMQTPFDTKIDGIQSQVYFSVSPPEFLPKGRSGDLDAILDIMKKAQKFIYVAVMDYIPGYIYNPTFSYWPTLTDQLLFRAFNHGIEVKLLISKWQSTRAIETTFLQSMDVLQNISKIQIKIFQFPQPIGPYVPYTLVNHNKYMVTDNCGYVGTNNWSADYFANTAGIGTIINQTDAVHKQPSLLNQTIQENLRQVFMRDWNSDYASFIPKP